MRSRTVFGLFLLVFLFLAPSAQAETAKDAIRALKKLEARTEAGISPRDYAPALGEAKFEVNLFLESQEAKQQPELAAVVIRVMEYYGDVGIVVGHNSRTSGKMIFLDDPSNASVLKVIQKYPMVLRDENDGGAMSGKSFLLKGDAAILIWAEASRELKTAMALLAN
ncbi:MAG: hypothetical protein V1806_13985 [Pseudomonadota bacterium]